MTPSEHIRGREQEEILLEQLLWLQCAPCASPQVSYCVLSLGFLTHAARTLVAGRRRQAIGGGGGAIRTPPGKTEEAEKIPSGHHPSITFVEGLSTPQSSVTRGVASALSSGGGDKGHRALGSSGGGETPVREALPLSSQSALTSRADGEKHGGESCCLHTEREPILEKSSSQPKRVCSTSREPGGNTDSCPSAAAAVSRISAPPLTLPEGDMMGRPGGLSRATTGNLDGEPGSSVDEEQHCRQTRKEGGRDSRGNGLVCEVDGSTGECPKSGEAWGRELHQGRSISSKAWQEATVEPSSESSRSPQGGTAFTCEAGLGRRGPFSTGYPGAESLCEETHSQDTESSPGHAFGGGEDSVAKVISQAAKRLLRVQDRRHAAAATALANYGIEGPVSEYWVDRLEDTFEGDSEVVFGSIHTRRDSGSPVSRGKKKKGDNKEPRESTRADSQSRRGIEGEQPLRVGKGRRKKTIGEGHKRTGKEEGEEDYESGKNGDEEREPQPAHSCGAESSEQATKDELAAMPCVVSVIAEVVGAGARGRKRSAIASVEFEAHISRVESYRSSESSSRLNLRVDFSLQGISGLPATFCSRAQAALARSCSSTGCRKGGFLVVQRLLRAAAAVEALLVRQQHGLSDKRSPGVGKEDLAALEEKLFQLQLDGLKQTERIVLKTGRVSRRGTRCDGEGSRKAAEALWARASTETFTVAGSSSFGSSGRVSTGGGAVEENRKKKSSVASEVAQEMFQESHRQKAKPREDHGGRKTGKRRSSPGDAPEVSGGNGRSRESPVSAADIHPKELEESKGDRGENSAHTTSEYLLQTGTSADSPAQPLGPDQERESVGGGAPVSSTSSSFSSVMEVQGEERVGTESAQALNSGARPSRNVDGDAPRSTSERAAHLETSEKGNSKRVEVRHDGAEDAHRPLCSSSSRVPSQQRHQETRNEELHIPGKPLEAPESIAVPSKTDVRAAEGKADRRGVSAEEGGVDTLPPSELQTPALTSNHQGVTFSRRRLSTESAAPSKEMKATPSLSSFASPIRGRSRDKKKPAPVAFDLIGDKPVEGGASHVLADSAFLNAAEPAKKVKTPRKDLASPAHILRRLSGQRTSGQLAGEGQGGNQGMRRRRRSAADVEACSIIAQEKSSDESCVSPSDRSSRRVTARQDTKGALLRSRSWQDREGGRKRGAHQERNREGGRRRDIANSRLVEETPAGPPAVASRYYTEFEELQQLGSGAFGSVTKVRQRQGGGVFAVKKIPLVSSSPRRRHQEGERMPAAALGGAGFMLTGGVGRGAVGDMRLKKGCILSAAGRRKNAGEEGRGASSVLGDIMARG
ncbi:eif2 kinase if2k-c, partial [Cystoisospora suis]